MGSVDRGIALIDGHRPASITPSLIIQVEYQYFVTVILLMNKSFSTTHQLDKSVVTIDSLSNQGDDKLYWRNRSPNERLAALEFMRQVMYGYHPATTRLQRVLTVTELERG